MRQDYCFDCGIPVEDLLQRNPKPSQLVYFCCYCSIDRGYPIETVKRNGAYCTTAPIGGKSHMPRWNYPNERSHKEKIVLQGHVGDLINWNVGEILTFDGKGEWRITQMFDTKSPLTTKPLHGFTIIDRETITKDDNSKGAARVRKSLPYQGIARRALGLSQETIDAINQDVGIMGSVIKK